MSQVELRAQNDGSHDGTRGGSPATAASANPYVAGAVDSTIRVDVGLLDRLMNLVGELVLARNQILQVTSGRDEAALLATSQRLNLITTRLQEGVMKTRMQPIGVVWNHLPRLVRDLATTLGKPIVIEMDGADTELDKSIIEVIKEPLTAVVHNACDHGIESPADRAQRGKPPEGRLHLRAFHEGGQVNIEMTDDGAGIDTSRLKQVAVQKGLIRPEQVGRIGEREALDLVFLPGIGGADPVAAGVPRAAGLDAVKADIERLGGTVDLASAVGRGTTVRIKIPLTLAIIPGLVVSAGVERFVIPQVSLCELIRLEGEGLRQIEAIEGTSLLRRRGSLLPLVHLRDLLDLGDDGERDGLVNVIVLQADGNEFGLVVDHVQDAQEIVVKPLDRYLKGLDVYAGATIMGDGRVALILDVHGIAELSSVLHNKRQSAYAEAGERREVADGATQNYLVFQAGSFERLAVPLSLVARLEEFPRARVERAGGHLVVQYRSALLHLVPLKSVLCGEPFDVAGLPDPVQVVVFSDRDRAVGLIVDRIVDILDDTLTVRQPSRRAGLSGSAVVGRKVTDFLDVDAVLQGIGDADAPTDPGDAPQATVVLADGSPFWRALTRNNLELAGLRVVEASSASDAIAACERKQVDVLLAALDLPGGADLVRQVRERLADLPVLGVMSGADGRQRPDEPMGFDGVVSRTDRDAVLQAVVAAVKRPPTGVPESRV